MGGGGGAAGGGGGMMMPANGNGSGPNGGGPGDAGGSGAFGDAAWAGMVSGDERGVWSVIPFHVYFLALLYVVVPGI